MTERSWSPHGRPFVWLAKSALRTIDEKASEPTSATLVYLSLCRIACDERSGTFSKPLAYVARLANLGRRTVERRIEDLERLKLLNVTRHKQRAAHTYALPSVTPPVRNDASPVRDVTPPVQRLHGALLREGNKRSTKKGETVPPEAAKRIFKEMREAAL